MIEDSGPLLPRDWQSLAPLVDRILDAPAAQRDALLTELAAGDPARRAQLEHLVAECERDLPLLNRPAVERFDQLLGEEPALPLPEVLGGRYRIEREVGRGGMARVFLAQDLKHARHVAVKVIRPELAASLGRDRFLREIGIAARLRHPNIMPLYDSGDADGVLYFVMPYEDGPSLRARLEAGSGLPIAEVISILRDVARALAYAHDQGVVHRDIKPDNVMVSGGAAVVTDFGIAKAFSAAQTEAGGSTITQSGSIIGTPAYMAPEQGMGDPATDHRADLYSFGCLAYELFTGKAPFTGSTTFQIVAAQMAMVPKPVTESRAEVPAAVAGLIARCLEKDPAARPQSASELLDGLAEVSTVDRAPMQGRRGPARLAAFLAVAAIGIATAGYFITRGRAADAGPVTVAVLPLGSQGGDSLQALVADGFSDDLATALVRLPWVRVVSRKGASNYRGQRDLDYKHIGKELGARYLVTGSFRNIDGRLTVLTRLVNTENESVLWADQFDRPAELAALRDRIVNTMGDSLRSKAGNRLRTQAVASSGTHRSSDDAYRLYLIGKRKLNQRGLSVAASIGLFRDAVALDPLSAEAYSGLSLALALSPYFHGVSAESVAAEATAAAQRALQLDPNLAEPHVALGLVLQHSFQWGRAEPEFRTALEIDSQDVEARVQYGRHLQMRGRFAESLRQFQAARENDPASAVVSSNLSSGWNYLGQLDSALAESSRAQRIDSENLPTILLGSLVLLTAGRNQDARQLIKGARAPYEPIALYVLAKTGERATVLERLRTLDDTRPMLWMAHTARAAAMFGFGDTAQALNHLELATEAREIWPSTIYSGGQRMFAGVRQSPRFHALLARVGLPAP